MKLTGLLVNTDTDPCNDNQEVHRGRRAPRIWALIADHKHFRIYSKQGDHLTLLGSASNLHFETNKGIRGPYNRVFSSCSRFIRHSIESRLPRNTKSLLDFSHDITTTLDDMLKKDMYDQLILIAPPKLLGLIRQKMTPTVNLRIAAEVNKDLMKMSDQALEAELKKILWF